MDSISPFSRLMELTAQVHGAVVNLHDVTGVTLQVPELRLKPDQLMHHGAFCRFAKLHGRNIQCSQNKNRSIAIAELRDKPFWGCCPFGVWDMAWPLKYKGKLTAVLYLGYFLSDRPLSRVERIVFDGTLPPVVSPGKIRTLRVAGKLLANTATLMMDQWVKEGGNLNAPRSSSFYRDATEQYIAAHFSEHVRLGNFADHLRVHPHYLGKMILRACGENFVTLLRRRRIEQAKLLLRVTTKNVTAIAYETGFQDGNYFSTIFRREEGCNPLLYRKRALRK
jgi:AraC-like DNA-binding protein